MMVYIFKYKYIKGEGSLQKKKEKER